jgi:hypothetical protein
MELVKEMQANKIRGDAMLYEGLATLLSKSNRSQEAVDILSKNSKKFTATLRTYNAMITVYGKHIGLKAAVEKFEELKRRFVPDVHTLSALLTTCTKLDPEVDTISQVRKLVLASLWVGCIPNLKTSLCITYPGACIYRGV